ncbi:hypothetical protein PSPO01_04834, partial [Paraphaeosphaeria sporulosa]
GLCHYREPTGNIAAFLKGIKEEVVKLKELHAPNITLHKEIKSLRDELFNASTVLESRTSVLQARSVELPTCISMVFLPASFVTSVFSMDTLSSSVNIREFAITLVAVCGVTGSKAARKTGGENEDHSTSTSRKPFARKPLKWTRRATDPKAGVDLERNRQT